MDMTTDFDKRLDQLSTGANRLPVAQTDALIAVFEHTKTAVSICRSLDIDCASPVAVEVLRQVLSAVSE